METKEEDPFDVNKISVALNFTVIPSGIRSNKLISLTVTIIVGLGLLMDAMLFYTSAQFVGYSIRGFAGKFFNGRPFPSKISRRICYPLGSNGGSGILSAWPL